MACSLTTAAVASQVVINFDDLSGGPYVNGSPVPPNSRLSDQLRPAYGITFDSGSHYVAVVDVGVGNTTSGANAIGGTSSGLVDYTAPVIFSFSSPSNP